MKLLIILLLLPQASPDKLLTDKVRHLFFQFDIDADAGDKLLHSLAFIDTDNSPTLMAYKGAAIAVSASADVGPFTKLSRFIEGKNLVEAAIKMKPDDPELRLIRLSIQLESPDFLEYNTRITDDINLIINNLIVNPASFPDFWYREKVLIFLQTKAHLSPEELNLLP